MLGRPVPGLPDLAGTPDLSGGFQIVALCYDDQQPQVAVRVIPESAVTPQILDRARAHAFDRHLRECPGTGSVFTVTAPTLAPMPINQR